MAQRPQLSATARQAGRKATLTALRHGGKIPGVLYGHGEPSPVALDRKEVEEFLRRHAPSALIDVSLDGDATTAMFKRVDHHPVTGFVWHLDIQRVSLSETVSAELPIAFTGTEEVEREGGVLTYQLSTLSISCRADHLPETLHLDVSQMRPGQLMRVGDLELPEGVTVSQSDDQVVVGCTHPAASAADLDADQQAAEAAAEAAAAAAAAAPATDSQE